MGILQQQAAYPQLTFQFSSAEQRQTRTLTQMQTLIIARKCTNPRNHKKLHGFIYYKFPKYRVSTCLLPYRQSLSETESNIKIDLNFITCTLKSACTASGICPTKYTRCCFYLSKCPKAHETIVFHSSFRFASMHALQNSKCIIS